MPHSVFNTDGVEICSIDFQEGYSLSSSNENISLIDMVDDRFITVHVVNEKNVSYLLVYRIDKESSSVEQVGAPMKARGAPTFVSRGTDVIVDLPESYGNSTVTVTSMSGSSEQRYQVPGGGGQQSISTDRMSPGVHIVTVDDTDANSRQSTKIVVK